MKNLLEAIELIKSSKHVTAFTGAGISVESGIPPFRGQEGLWSKYDSIILDIQYFKKNEIESWKVIKEIFYDFFGQAKPNPAHFALAELEKLGIVKTIITQNIDGLHQEAGSKNVLEYHGTSRSLTCMECNSKFAANEIDLSILPPKCKFCNGTLKPDFVFFGEQIPEPANYRSFNEAKIADIFLIIGTTGEIMPASLIPIEAKEMGAKIIEINTAPSKYTNSITDFFLEGKASGVMSDILKNLKTI